MATQNIPRPSRQAEPRSCANCQRTVYTKSGAPEVFCKLCADHNEEDGDSFAEYASTRHDQDE